MYGFAGAFIGNGLPKPLHFVASRMDSCYNWRFSEAIVLLPQRMALAAVRKCHINMELLFWESLWKKNPGWMPSTLP